MSDQLKVIVVGHDSKTKCAVANALCREKSCFKQVYCNKMYSVTVKAFTHTGVSPCVINTPCLATPAWKQVFRRFEKEDAFKTRCFVYVKDMTSLRVNDLKSIDRITHHSRDQLIVAIPYRPSKKEAAEMEMSHFAGTWNTILLKLESPVEEMDSFSKKVFSCISTSKPLNTTQEGTVLYIGDKSGGHSTSQTLFDVKDEVAEEEMMKQIDSVRLGPSHEFQEERTSSEADVTLTNAHWELYHQTLASGTVMSYHTRVNVVGFMSAGKTTLVRRLQSTNVANVNSVVPTECLEIAKTASCCIESETGRIWETQLDGFEKDINYTRMATALVFLSLDGDDTASNSGQHVASDTISEVTRGPVGPDMRLQYEIKKEYLTNAIQRAQNSPGLRRYISYWDFAGQATYYTTHQAFLAPNAVYLLVVDLSKDLDSVLEDSMEFRTHTYHKTTILDAVRYWAGSIKAFASDDDNNIAPIIVVGTHADKVQDKEKIEHMFEQVKDVIGESDLSCIAIDNTIPFENDETLVDLKDRILDKALGIIKREIKAQWIELEHWIILEKEKGEVLITFEQLQTINGKLDQPLKKDDLVQFLEHQHCNGLLMYFNKEVLKDIIILEPALLADFINLLLRKTGRSVTGWNADGTFNQTFIKNVTENPPMNKYRDTLLQMLIHLKVILPMEITNIMSTFFMPSLLRERPTDDSAFDNATCEMSPMIRMSFQGKLVPPAFFHTLVVSCLFMWKADYETDAKGKNKTTMYYHYSRFRIVEHGETLLEMYWKECRIFIRFIHLSEETKLQDQNCLRHLETIEEKAIDILDTYRHDNITCVVEIECPTPTHKEFLSLEYLKLHGKARCESPGNYHMVSAEQALSNLTKITDRGNAGTRDEKDILPDGVRNRVITEGEIVKLCQKIGVDYQLLFIMLGISYAIIQQSLADNNGVTSPTILQLFFKWRNKMGDEATVGNFLKVLPDIGIHERTMWDVFK